MAYADYEYYKKQYWGEMGEDDYKRLSRQASAYLNQVTFGKIAEVDDLVKDATCAVCDAMLLNENGGGVASETNDGISVNYLAGVSTAMTEGQRLYEAAALYLGGTGLLYRGV